MLRSLELFGFKSFADRTRFDLHTGITCVVGPNGSGKSNVVDALKWILGDQSAKSLRGKEMIDVIFNGAKGRKPSPYAEATLTFDNRQQLLAIEAAEVQVGRRLYRTGDAEYLINGQVVRLKDVRDLFLGTGAGSAAYSIIEQGRVDQILQANPTSRRAVFEEAAGISRFRARKTEALRRLERVDQTLLRLTDIVDQVEAQLNSTRSQAAKAAKYREISSELKTWWHGFAADEVRLLRSRVEALEATLLVTGGQLDEISEQQTALEAEEHQFDQQLGELDQRLRSTERRRAAVREAITGFETTLQYQTVRLQELASETERLQQQQRILSRRCQEARMQAAESAERLARLTGSRDDATGLSAAEQHAQQLRAELDQLLAANEQERSLLRKTEAQLSELRAVVAGYQSQATAAEERFHQIETRRKTVAADQQAALTRRDDQARILQELTANSTVAQELMRGVQERQQSARLSLQRATDQLSRLREERSALQARKHLLEDLELRQEALAIGVREILQRARTTQLPPWNTVIGQLVELLDVELEQAPMLEIALGPRAQLLVVREYQPWIDYLSRAAYQFAGRIGFLAVPEGDLHAAFDLPEFDQSRFHFWNPRAIRRVDLSQEAGVVMRADALIAAARGPAALAEAVLGDTWIVQNLATAIRLATGPGRGCRFVTRQGELFDADGTLSVGSLRAETALFPRKSELRQIKVDLVRMDQQLVATEQQCTTAQIEVHRADESLQEALIQLDRSSVEVADARAHFNASNVEFLRLCEELDALTAEQQRTESALQTLLRQLADSRQTIVTTENQLQQLEQQARAGEARTAEVQSAWNEARQRVAAEEWQRTQQVERLAGLEQQLARDEAEIEQRAQQMDEAARRYRAAKEKQAQIRLYLLNTGAELDEQFVHLDVIAGEVTGLVEQQSQLRTRRSQLTQQEQALRKQRRTISEQQHQQEMQLRDARQALSSLAARLEEEDQLTTEALLETGVSAYELFLQGRKPRAHVGTSADEEGAGAVAEADAAASKTAADDSSHSATDEPVATGVSDGAPSYDDVRPQIEAHVTRLRKRLKMLGSVNTDSLNDLEALEERFTGLSAQLQDLVEAKQNLEEIIRRVNQECKRLFQVTFTVIRDHFRELFRKVFGGGEGDIILEDPDDVLECGIDIKARPPGKELRSISLLSGGEKTMTAIALIMAIFKAKPSPFCILDEVDAALDEANVERFTGVIQEFRKSTQFIMITHHKRSMVVADLIFGVTMEESGISKRMSVRFEDVSDSGEFRTPPANAAA